MSKKTLSTILADDNVENMRQYLASPKGNANYSINYITLLGMAKSKEMAQLLIDKGADVHKEEYGFTPFLYQAAATRPEVMKVILNKDPTVISHTDSRGWNALHLCVSRASKKSLECVPILLNTKIDINAITKAGYTALDISMLAADNEEDPNINASIIKLLINKGVNTTLHKDTVRLPKAELVKRFVKEKMERDSIKYNQAYRGLSEKIPENVVGINIKGFVEGPQPKGQGRPEYPARNSRKSRKALKGKSRKGKTFKRKN